VERVQRPNNTISQVGHGQQAARTGLPTRVVFFWSLVPWYQAKVEFYGQCVVYSPINLFRYQLQLRTAHLPLTTTKTCLLVWYLFSISVEALRNPCRILSALTMGLLPDATVQQVRLPLNTEICCFAAHIFRASAHTLFHVFEHIAVRRQRWEYR